MKLQIKIVIVTATLILCSCSSTKYSYRQSNIQKNNLISGEVVVDTKLDLTKKVEATSSPRKTVVEAKEEAYYKAITQNNIDIVVDPIFEVRTAGSFLGFGGKSTVKIVGFGANYVNPRTKVEAVNELTAVDTANIRKFNAIYLNRYSKKTLQQGIPANSKIGVSLPTTKQKKNWGIEFGMLNSSITGGYSNENTAKSYCIGLFKETSLSTKFDLYRALTYTSEGNGTQKLNYLRIPIMAKYFVWKKISINGGVQIGYTISNSGFEGLSDPATVDYGILYGVGYRVSDSFSLNYKLYKGINTVSSQYGEDLKNINISLNLAYRF